MVSKEYQYQRLERNGWAVAQTHIDEFAVERERALYPGQRRPSR